MQHIFFAKFQTFELLMYSDAKNALPDQHATFKTLPALHDLWSYLYIDLQWNLTQLSIQSSYKTKCFIIVIQCLITLYFYTIAADKP